MPDRERRYRRLLLQALQMCYGARCCRCPELVDITLPGYEPMGPTLDHFNPVATMGLDDFPNIRLAHNKCNQHHGIMLGARVARVRRHGFVRRRAVAPGTDQGSLW